MILQPKAKFPYPSGSDTSRAQACLHVSGTLGPVPSSELERYAPTTEAHCVEIRQQPVEQQLLSVQLTFFCTQVNVLRSQEETGQVLPTAAVVTPPVGRQSLSAQHAPQVVPPQQIGVFTPHDGLLTHLCVLRSQLSVVQSLPSSHCLSEMH
jgi:hypothetical protein